MQKNGKYVSESGKKSINRNRAGNKQMKELALKEISVPHLPHIFKKVEKHMNIMRREIKLILKIEMLFPEMKNTVP